MSGTQKLKKRSHLTFKNLKRYPSKKLYTIQRTVSFFPSLARPHTASTKKYTRKSQATYTIQHMTYTHMIKKIHFSDYMTPEQGLRYRPSQSSFSLFPKNSLLMKITKIQFQGRVLFQINPSCSLFLSFHTNCISLSPNERKRHTCQVFQSGN